MMLFKHFELSIYQKMTELCKTPAWAVLLVHRSMSNAPSYNVCSKIKENTNIVNCFWSYSDS